jgi:transketolase
MGQNMEYLDLKKRVIDIAFKHRLSHLGSYLSSLKIIDDIYSKMKNEDIFILSSGHCALALYTILEKYKGVDAEKLFMKHGGHPYRDEANGLYCSTGSLGLGLPIAVGRALGNSNRNVHCLISDGECAEGSIWEALRYAHEHSLTNLKIYLNINGYCAYETVNSKYLVDRITAFHPDVDIRFTTVEHFPFLKGLNAHYHIMNEDDYKLACAMIKCERDFNEKVIR